ncbi:SNF2 family DNA/RNA helicase [Achlya hypogyna]|uniref:SNF2 family DNA/RNA helicase n=1 Tax=Achlya hypogyna TaxID=1202772 RepID=A0A1V9ZDT9_ACHHY|nr:SNF2 family DNA/RNA helicase [Achlya hypogyna]
MGHWEDAYEGSWRGYVEGVLDERFGAAAVRTYKVADGDVACMERLFRVLHEDPPSGLEEDGSYEYHTPASVSFEYTTPGPKKKRQRWSSPGSYFPEFDSNEFNHSIDDVSMKLCRRMAALSPITSHRVVAEPPTSGHHERNPSSLDVIPFALPDGDSDYDEDETPTIKHRSSTQEHHTPTQEQHTPTQEQHTPTQEHHTPTIEARSPPIHHRSPTLEYASPTREPQPALSPLTPPHDDEIDLAGDDFEEVKEVEIEPALDSDASMDFDLGGDNALDDAQNLSLLLGELGMVPEARVSSIASDSDDDILPRALTPPRTAVLRGRTRLRQQEAMHKSMCSEVSSFNEDLMAADMTFLSPVGRRVHTTRGLALQSAQKRPPLVLERYQARAVRWMQGREAPTTPEQRRGGILADEMGLGKTISCLALIEQSPRGRPTLIIAPLSVLAQWEFEVKAKTSLSVGVYHGTGRKRFRHQPDFCAFDVILSTYDVLRMKETAVPVASAGRSRDTSWIAAKRQREEKQLLSRLHKIHWERVILDEAHLIANMASARTQASFQLLANARWCVTGTPIQNRLEDLHPLFKFLGIPRIKDDAHLESLVGLYLLRRLKAGTVRGVPDKVEERVELSFATDAERRWYRQVHHITRREVQATLGRAKTSALHVFELLLRLRQVCNTPALLTAPATGDENMPPVPLSTKMQTLFDALRAAVAAREPCLVVSEWRSFLDCIRRQLRAINPEMRVAQLDGRLSPQERTQVVQAYQAGQTHVLLLSLKTGALGLNLTATRRVFVMEPSWNPSLESQAIDRAHRIGQTHAVTVTRYIMKGTIEDKIYAMQKEKRSMMQQMLRDHNADRSRGKRVLKRKDVVDLVLQ